MQQIPAGIELLQRQDIRHKDIARIIKTPHPVAQASYKSLATVKLSQLKSICATPLLNRPLLILRKLQSTQTPSRTSQTLASFQACFWVRHYRSNHAIGSGKRSARVQRALELRKGREGGVADGSHEKGRRPLSCGVPMMMISSCSPSRKKNLPTPRDDVVRQPVLCGKSRW
ncbi:hypothetical protein EUGRSUZ_I01997 [Eucalyptus grandis]|uniref:Uncharacterized protein n=2 Tax=Eucalyptus grandis TaxID=71139 RepID=A0ACC3JH64_EUCGR|nr:hypothetical protein EUGRSUZ_I01997 [Eucalyptus grandis]